MSMFVECFDKKKECNIILNLDTITHIAPLREGGCEVFFSEYAVGAGLVSVLVAENYSEFKQFVMTKVRPEDIAARFPTSIKEPIAVPQLKVTPPSKPPVKKTMPIVKRQDLPAIAGGEVSQAGTMAASIANPNIE